jgi:hypothetical protein
VFKILDITGKEVMSGLLSNDNTIDLLGIQTGIYFVKFGNGIVKKVIKK